MWNLIKPRSGTLWFWQLGLLILLFVFWALMNFKWVTQREG